MRPLAIAATLALLALPALAQDKVPDTCGAAALQGLIGGPAPESVPGTNPVRTYADGDMVTMDFNPQRINIILDAATRSTVVAITCG